jgi:hypothetical protein
VWIFILRLARCSLHMGDVRHHRNMAPSSACSICGQEDSSKNSIIECTMSRCVCPLAHPSVVEHISLTTEPGSGYSR